MIGRPRPPHIIPPTDVGPTHLPGSFNYSHNVMIFDVANVSDPQELEDRIFHDICLFTYFNGGCQDEAWIYVTPSGDAAWFDMSGWPGTGSDFINSDYSPVRIYPDDDTHVMVADTCSGHMLQGNRWWTVKVDDEGNNHATVSLETWSVDRPVGVINTVGYTLYSTRSAI